MTAILRIEGLNKRFGGIVAANHISLVLHPGEVVGIIGPNGAGKTTLFNLITGALPKDSGEIFMRGLAVGHLPTYARITHGIARTWQNNRLFASLSLLDNLIIGVKHYPGERLFQLCFRPKSIRAVEESAREAAMKALAIVGLSHRADALPSELSYGQQKLVALARAIMNDGQCLLLDEPMAGVSGQIFDRIKKVIREQRDAGKAILLVEHNISFVKEVSNRVIFMASGTVLAQGPLDEMLANPQLTELYFGATAPANP